MTLHIDHAVSEITPEPESLPQGPAAETRYQVQERLRADMRRQERLRLRVFAEGMDD